MKTIDDPTLTVSDCDLRLSDLAGRLGETRKEEEKEEILDTANRWLDRRAELAFAQELQEATKGAPV